MLLAGKSWWLFDVALAALAVFACKIKPSALTSQYSANEIQQPKIAASCSAPIPRYAHRRPLAREFHRLY